MFSVSVQWLFSSLYSWTMEGLKDDNWTERKEAMFNSQGQLAFGCKINELCLHNSSIVAPQ